MFFFQKHLTETRKTTKTYKNQTPTHLFSFYPSLNGVEPASPFKRTRLQARRHRSPVHWWFSWPPWWSSLHRNTFGLSAICKSSWSVKENTKKRWEMSKKTWNKEFLHRRIWSTPLMRVLLTRPSCGQWNKFSWGWAWSSPCPNLTGTQLFFFFFFRLTMRRDELVSDAVDFAWWFPFPSRSGFMPVLGEWLFWCQSWLNVWFETCNLYHDITSNFPSETNQCWESLGLEDGWPVFEQLIRNRLISRSVRI